MADYTDLTEGISKVGGQLGGQVGGQVGEHVERQVGGTGVCVCVI